MFPVPTAADTVAECPSGFMPCALHPLVPGCAVRRLKYSKSNADPSTLPKPPNELNVTSFPSGVTCVLSVFVSTSAPFLSGGETSSYPRPSGNTDPAAHELVDPT